MRTRRESKCCHEYPQLRTIISGSETPISCITQHPGFEGGCLNVWALLIAHNAYRQQYGAVKHPLHKYVYVFIMPPLI